MDLETTSSDDDIEVAEERDLLNTTPKLQEHTLKQRGLAAIEQLKSNPTPLNLKKLESIKKQVPALAKHVDTLVENMNKKMKAEHKLNYLLTKRRGS